MSPYPRHTIHFTVRQRFTLPNIHGGGMDSFPTAAQRAVIPEDEGHGRPSSSSPNGEDHDIDLSRSEFEQRFHPFFAADIASLRVVAPPYLFDSIMRSRTLTLISAEPYTGKTLLMLSMLLSLDAASPLFTRFTPAKNHRCLFLGQDAPTWDYHAQFSKLFYGLQLPKEKEHNISLPSMLLLNRGLALTDPEFLPFISTIIDLYGITVLFIDTLLEFHNADENSNREMSHIMRLLKLIRDKFSLSIIFSHHTSKSSFTSSTNYRARGASTISGTIDHHFALTLRHSNPPTIALEFAKGRGLSFSDNPIPYFIIKSFVRSDGRESVSLIPSPKPMSEQLLDFLITPQDRASLESFYSSHMPKTKPSTIKSRVSRILDALRDSNTITQVEHGRWVQSQSVAERG